jgi:hypothetical protein
MTDNDLGGLLAMLATQQPQPQTQNWMQYLSQPMPTAQGGGGANRSNMSGLGQALFSLAGGGGMGAMAGAGGAAGGMGMLGAL